MSSRSRSAQGLSESYHSTFHAFFLAAKDMGYTEFELQLVTRAKDRIEFRISARGNSELTAKFDVRGNTVRAAAGEASVSSGDDADVQIDYGGTRSGEEPVRVLSGRKV